MLLFVGFAGLFAIGPAGLETTAQSIMSAEREVKITLASRLWTKNDKLFAD
jgi:hypothetical protein